MNATEQFDEDGEKIEDAKRELIKAEREAYLAGIGKSYSWEEIKNMAMGKELEEV